MVKLAGDFQRSLIGFVLMRVDHTRECRNYVQFEGGCPRSVPPASLEATMERPLMLSMDENGALRSYSVPQCGTDDACPTIRG
jgi:hypothetical protein